jgi:hypothetical protein
MAADRTPRKRLLPVAGLLLGVATAACSAIIGLDAPPAETGGMPDATSGADVTSTDAGIESVAPADGAVTCMPLDAGGSVYFSLTPTLDDAGTSNWSFFDVQALPGFGTAGFAGGTFDGRYLYFAGNAGKVARYDTTQPFDAPSAWASYAPTGASGGLGGAVFDGRYVYFVPYLHGVVESIASRFDTLGLFDAPDSWTTFDLATLSADGGAVTSGFFGAVFDGRYVFFIPRNDGAPDGRVLRYDSQVSADAAAPAPDAGPAAADGGDDGSAPAPGSFGDPSLWQSFDVTSINPEARGFAGGVAGAASLFLVPYVNDAFDAAVHAGNSGIAARHALGGSFTTPATWSAFDTTTVSSFANEYIGGAFDGQHVYFVPHATGIATRFDTTGTFTSTPSWSAYDMTRLTLLDSGLPVQYAGAAYDGRFIYFMPSASGVAPVARYDTLSTFTADCAWSVFDPTSLAASGGSVLQPFMGAVFDGTYLYLIPNSGPHPIFARFTVRTPAPLPANFPNFHGSFL